MIKDAVSCAIAWGNSRMYFLQWGKWSNLHKKPRPERGKREKTFANRYRKLLTNERSTHRRSSALRNKKKSRDISHVANNQEYISFASFRRRDQDVQIRCSQDTCEIIWSICFITLTCKLAGSSYVERIHCMSVPFKDRKGYPSTSLLPLCQTRNSNEQSKSGLSNLIAFFRQYKTAWVETG